MTATLKRRSRFTELDNYPYLVMKHGSATKYWLFRGDNKQESGVRNAAKQWPLVHLGSRIDS